MSGESDQAASSATARNLPAIGDANMIPPLGDLREPHASFSTTSVLSEASGSSKVVTQHDLESCMHRMEERFESSLERLSRNFVTPSQIDEITNHLDQLTVISPTQPMHGPYRARMGPSMYTRPPPHLGFPLPAGFQQRFVEPFSRMNAPHVARHKHALPGPHVVAPLPLAPGPRGPSRFVPEPSVRFQPATPPHVNTVLTNNTPTQANPPNPAAYHSPHARDSPRLSPAVLPQSQAMQPLNNAYPLAEPPVA